MFDMVDYSQIQRHTVGYPGKFMTLEQIKPGQRFYFLDGPDKNIKDWYEIVEFEYDWRYQSWIVVLWNNETERFIRMQKRDVYMTGRID